MAITGYCHYSYFFSTRLPRATHFYYHLPYHLPAFMRATAHLFPNILRSNARPATISLPHLSTTCQHYS